MIYSSIILASTLYQLHFLREKLLTIILLVTTWGHHSLSSSRPGLVGNLDPQCEGHPSPPHSSHHEASAIKFKPNPEPQPHPNFHVLTQGDIQRLF